MRTDLFSWMIAQWGGLVVAMGVPKVVDIVGASPSRDACVPHRDTREWEALCDAVRAAVAVSGGGLAPPGLLELVRELAGRSASRALCVGVMAEALGFRTAVGQDRSVIRHEILSAMLGSWRWDAKAVDDVREALAILNATPLHLVIAASKYAPAVSVEAAATKVGERMGFPCEVRIHKEGNRHEATRLTIKGKEQGVAGDVQPPPTFDLSDGLYCPHALTLDRVGIARANGVWVAGGLHLVGCDPGWRTPEGVPREITDLHPGVDASGRVTGTASVTLDRNGFTAAHGFHAHGVNLLDERKLEARSLSELDLSGMVTHFRVTGLTSIGRVDGTGLPEGISLDFDAVISGQSLTVERLQGEAILSVNLDYGTKVSLADCSLAEAIFRIASGSPVTGGDGIGITVRDSAIADLVIERGIGKRSLLPSSSLANGPLFAWDLAHGVRAERCAFGTMRVTAVVLSASGPFRFTDVSIARLDMDDHANHINTDFLNGVRIGGPRAGVGSWPQDRPLPGMIDLWDGGRGTSVIPTGVLGELVLRTHG